MYFQSVKQRKRKSRIWVRLFSFSLDAIQNWDHSKLEKFFARKCRLLLSHCIKGKLDSLIINSCFIYFRLRPSAFFFHVEILLPVSLLSHTLGLGSRGRFFGPARPGQFGPRWRESGSSFSAPHLGCCCCCFWPWREKLEILRPKTRNFLLENAFLLTQREPDFSIFPQETRIFFGQILSLAFFPNVFCKFVFLLRDWEFNFEIFVT